jgi:tRNA threonylcarbamoyladenosine biosynthesis protein TsaE
LGEGVQVGDLLLLSGTLGAGKTCLVQGIAFGMGVPEYARSPTFVLVNQYAGRLTLFHVDLFRIEDVREAADLALDECYERGVCVVEWAERAKAIFPPEHMWVDITYGRAEDQRRLRFRARGPRYQQLLERLRAFAAVGGRR